MLLGPWGGILAPIAFDWKYCQNWSKSLLGAIAQSPYSPIESTAQISEIETSQPHHR